MITVVIPALNEGKTVGDVIACVRRYTSDIIVSASCSQDNTASIAFSLGAQVIYDRKKGKGNAIRTAIPHIKKEITVFIDADGSHEPDDIPRLVQPILEDKADHVTGSRFLGGSSDSRGGFNKCFRIAGSSLITASINRRFGARLTDSQSGFRAIRTCVLRSLDLREDITTI